MGRYTCVNCRGLASCGFVIKMKWFKDEYVDPKLNTLVGRFKYNLRFKTRWERILVITISTLLFPAINYVSYRQTRFIKQPYKEL